MFLILRSIHRKYICQPAQLSNNFHRTFMFKRKKFNEQERSDYVIELAQVNDFPTIMKLMQEVYYCDEPTCAALGVKSNPLMEKRAENFLHEGMSFVAKCRCNGNIIGACINCSVQPWDPDLTERLACSSRDEKVKTLLLFYAHITRTGDLWSSFDTKKVFEITYLFVKPEYRRKGISTKFVKKSLQLGADCGYPVIRYDATNFKTALLCQKLGMQLHDAIPFCSYLGRNHKPIFCPPHPNESVKIYIKTNN